MKPGEMLQRYRVVAIDYDGTLAESGSPAGEVLDALGAVRARGCTTLLCTGRRLDDLLEAFPRAYTCFDAVVAENGGVLAGPLGTRRLARPVDARLADALGGRGVRLARGEVLLACAAQDDLAVFEEIRRLDLDCQLIRNREAIMVLPAGVTKASGLEAALRELGLSPHSAVAIGDAENDLAMLQLCEVGVAVANAVPLLLQSADLVLARPDGAGVAGFLRGDLLAGKRLAPGARWRVQLGLADGGPVSLPSSQLSVLVTGASHSGKSFLAGLLAEQLLLLGYSLLVIDPEGDHVHLGRLPGVLVLGGDGPLPPPEQAAILAGRPVGGVVVDLSRLSREDATRYLRELAPLAGRQRSLRGLPHWVLVDEAHGALAWRGAAADLMLANGGCMFVTYRPNQMGSRIRAAVDAVVAACGGQRTEMEAVADTVAEHGRLDRVDVLRRLQQAGAGQALLALRDRPGELVMFTVGRRLVGHVRHWHKYAVLEQPFHLRFLFRDGSGQSTGVTAGNLQQLHHELQRCAPESIRHHVRHHDFSRWVYDVFRDRTLARALEAVEISAMERESPVAPVRQQLLNLIEARYLL